MFLRCCSVKTPSTLIACQGMRWQSTQAPSPTPPPSPHQRQYQLQQLKYTRYQQRRKRQHQQFKQGQGRRSEASTLKYDLDGTAHNGTYNGAAVDNIFSRKFPNSYKTAKALNASTHRLSSTHSHHEAHGEVTAVAAAFPHAQWSTSHGIRHHSTAAGGGDVDYITRDVNGSKAEKSSGKWLGLRLFLNDTVPAGTSARLSLLNRRSTSPTVAASAFAGGIFSASSGAAAAASTSESPVSFSFPPPQSSSSSSSISSGFAQSEARRYEASVSRWRSVSQAVQTEAARHSYAFRLSSQHDEEMSNRLAQAWFGTTLVVFTVALLIDQVLYADFKSYETMTKDLAYVDYGKHIAAHRKKLVKIE